MFASTDKAEWDTLATVNRALTPGIPRQFLKGILYPWPTLIVLGYE